MKFQFLRFLSLILYFLLGHFISRHWKLLRYIWCQSQMNEWMWSIVRVIMTGKINTLREKPGPVPLCPPKITYGLAYKWTWASVLWGPGLTVRAIYLLWEKWPKNAFYCTDQSRCVVHVACVTNTGCVLFEQLYNRNCHKQFCLQVGYVCQISHIQYLD